MQKVTKSYDFWDIILSSSYKDINRLRKPAAYTFRVETPKLRQHVPP